MVGRVLTKNNNVTTKTKNTYSLNGFKNLNTSQVKELKLICEDKILNYLDNRKKCMAS